MFFYYVGSYEVDCDYYRYLLLVLLRWKVLYYYIVLDVILVVIINCNCLLCIRYWFEGFIYRLIYLSFIIFLGGIYYDDFVFIYKKIEVYRGEIIYLVT